MSSTIKNMQIFAGIYMVSCLLFMSTLNTGCSACEHYIQPNYKEFTTGGVFKDKYWNQWSGGSCVKLDGTFNMLDTRVVSGGERVVFSMNVPGGLRLVTVYADRSFASELYELEAGQEIIVYGKALSIVSHSREDRGFTGGELAVELEEIEYP